jgi:hypothetical protein
MDPFQLFKRLLAKHEFAHFVFPFILILLFKGSLEIITRKILCQLFEMAAVLFEFLFRLGVESGYHADFMT